MTFRPLGAVTLVTTAILGGCSTSTISKLANGLPNDGSTLCADFDEKISGFGFNEEMIGHLVRSNANALSGASDTQPGCAISHGGSGPGTGVAAVPQIAPVVPVTAPKTP